MTVADMWFRARLVLWRLLVRAGRKGIHRFTLPDGSSFDYPFASAVGKHLFAGGFEAAEIAFIRARLKPGDIVLDVGANAGLYAVIAARMVGDAGHVFAFEPDVTALQLLRRNLEANGLRNVTVIDAATSNTSGQAAFAVADDIAMGSLAAIDRADQHVERWETVRTVRLDDVVAERGIGPVALIKMDVEGAEKLALEGATALLSGGRPPATILFEAFAANARAFGYDIRSLFDLLRAHGYTISGLDRTGSLQPEAAIPSESLGTTVYNFVAQRDVPVGQ